MHELPVIEKILKISLDAALENNAKKIVSINIEIGALSDFQDVWMKKFFDALAKGTIAEGAIIKVDKQPGEFRCVKCNNFIREEFIPDRKNQCPKCSGEMILFGNSDYIIKDIEVI